MKNFKKIISAAISAVMLLVLMCGCGGSAQQEETESTEYDYLKTEIVGIWMEYGGTVLREDPVFGYSYPFFEFTSTNEVYNHSIILDENKNFSDAASKSGTYRLDGNLLVYVEDNVGAYIDIKDGVMTMTNDSGSTKYERLTVAQALEGSLYYKDEELLQQERDLQAQLDKEAREAAQAAQSSASETTEANPDTSEETAAEAVTEDTAPAETETTSAAENASSVEAAGETETSASEE